MHFRILAEVDNRSQEVEQPLVSLETLKQLNERFSCQLLVVLGGDLYADLKVLTDVRLEHGFEAF